MTNICHERHSPSAPLPVLKAQHSIASVPRYNGILSIRVYFIGNVLQQRTSQKYLFAKRWYTLSKLEPKAIIIDLADCPN